MFHARVPNLPIMGTNRKKVVEQIVLSIFRKRGALRKRKTEKHSVPFMSTPTNKIVKNASKQIVKKCVFFDL